MENAKSRASTTTTTTSTSHHHAGRIFINSHGYRDTGGPEALLQLALALHVHGHAVHLFPVRGGGGIAPAFLKEYPLLKGIPIMTKPVPTTIHDVVVLSDAELCENRYGHARVLHWILNDKIYNTSLSRSPWKGCTPIAHNALIGERFRAPVVRPYTRPSTSELCRSVRAAESGASSSTVAPRDLILLDNDNPPAVRDALPSAIWVHNFTKAGVHELLRRAVVIIDWTMVGSERLPIEALLCGAKVLTARDEPYNSAAGADFDLPADAFVGRVEELPARVANVNTMGWPDAAVAHFDGLNQTTMYLDAVRAGIVPGRPPQPTSPPPSAPSISPSQHHRHPRHPPSAHHLGMPSPPPLAPLPPPHQPNVYNMAASTSAAAAVARGEALVHCPTDGSYAAPWHHGNLLCRPPTTGACNSSFKLQQRLSGHGKCFPDGDLLVNTNIMWGGYGCYPGLGILWVVNRCSGRFACESGRIITCGSSASNGHTNCSCG